MRPCPWCKADLSFARLPVQRRVLRWRNVPVTPNNTALCPNCHKPVREAVNQWLYLPQLPLLYYLYWALSRFHLKEAGLLELAAAAHWWDWIIVFVGISALVLQQHGRWYERNWRLDDEGDVE